MTNRLLINDFFDAFSECFAPHHTVQTPRTPRDMIVGADTLSEGWVEWRLLPCAADLTAGFAEIERACGFRYPASFKSWYSHSFTLDMDISVVRLPANPSNDPLGPLRELPLGHPEFASHSRKLSLLPFGDESMMDAGPLCFEAQAGIDPDRWPIRYWDHEWSGSPKEIGPVIFSSFERLLAACTAYMRCFAAIRRESSSASDAPVDRRGPCIRRLVEADPEGAGGPGRHYWESWIR